MDWAWIFLLGVLAGMALSELASAIVDWIERTK